MAHAACACYENDDELQYSTAEAGSAQAAGSWSAGQPMRRRLNYLVPTSIQDRSIPLAVQKYMHKAAGVYSSCTCFVWSYLHETLMLIAIRDGAHVHL